MWKYKLVLAFVIFSSSFSTAQENKYRTAQKIHFFYSNDDLIAEEIHRVAKDSEGIFVPTKRVEFKEDPITKQKVKEYYNRTEGNTWEIQSRYSSVVTADGDCELMEKMRFGSWVKQRERCAQMNDGLIEETTFNYSFGYDKNRVAVTKNRSKSQRRTSIQIIKQSDGSEEKTAGLFDDDLNRYVNRYKYVTTQDLGKKEMSLLRWNSLYNNWEESVNEVHFQTGERTDSILTYYWNKDLSKWKEKNWLRVLFEYKDGKLITKTTQFRVATNAENVMGELAAVGNSEIKTQLSNPYFLETSIAIRELSVESEYGILIYSGMGNLIYSERVSGEEVHRFTPPISSEDIWFVVSISEGGKTVYSKKVIVAKGN